MGLFDSLFGRLRQRPYKGYFKLLNGYAPIFTPFGGNIYESELCRASIDAIARNAGKLRFTHTGSAQHSLITQLEKSPNSFMTWSQFLMRTATILNVQNTAFIVPVIGKYGETVGLYPICPESWELVQVEGESNPWIRFRYYAGQTMAIELNRVGIMVRHQYKSDVFGESNAAMSDTMDLIKIQRQGIKEYAKNSASYRFMAKVGNFSKTEDLKKERERFSEENFQEGGGGILLFPNTYNDIKQVTQQSFVVDAKQMEVIDEHVFNYFGVNKDVLQNKAIGDAWMAFYEGAVEPFAIQLSEVVTKMIYTPREQGAGNAVYFTSNRLQYLSNADKLSVSSELVDRGVLSINESREIWNLPPIEGGDTHMIRGEYYDMNSKISEVDKNAENN